MEGSNSVGLGNQMQTLAGEMGEVLYNWGFKRVHGKIWTYLFLSSRPLEASDLVRKLDISKALISISIREMLDLGIIIDLGKGTRGTHLYRNNPDLVQVLITVLKKREIPLVERLIESQRVTSSYPEADWSSEELDRSRFEDFVRVANSIRELFEKLIATPGSPLEPYSGQYKTKAVETQITPNANKRSSEYLNRPGGGSSNMGLSAQAKKSEMFSMQARSEAHEDVVCLARGQIKLS